MSDISELRKQLIDLIYPEYGKTLDYDDLNEINQYIFNEIMQKIDQHTDKQVAAADTAGRIAGMKSAQSRVLRRTEIPRDAKNPTRDATVILGEVIAEIIEQDIVNLTAKQSKEGL